MVLALETLVVGAIALLAFIACLPRCLLRNRRNRWWTPLEELPVTSPLNHTNSPRSPTQAYFGEPHLESIVVDEGRWKPPVSTVSNSTARQHPSENNRLQSTNRRYSTAAKQPQPASSSLIDLSPKNKKSSSSAMMGSLSGMGDRGALPGGDAQPAVEMGLQRSNSLPDMVSDADASEGEKGREALAYGVSMDIGTRRTMEDTHLAVPHLADGQLFPDIRALVGVFDGHNGPEVAQFAADKFLSFMEEMKECTVLDLIQGAFQRCEEELLKRKEEHSIAGSTALVAVVHDHMMHIANLGDCRAVLCKDGQAVQVTKDHKPSNEKDRILAAGGFLDGDQYLNGEIGVSRAFGNFHLEADGIKKKDGSGPLIAVPEMHSQELTQECEFLVLGSDGVWDVISNQRAADIVHKHLVNGSQPQKAAEELVQEAKIRGSCDNITAVVLALRSLPLPPKKILRRKNKHSCLKLSSRSMLDIKSAIQAADMEPSRCPLDT